MGAVVDIDMLPPKAFLALADRAHAIPRARWVVFIYIRNGRHFDFKGKGHWFPHSLKTQFGAAVQPALLQ